MALKGVIWVDNDKIRWNGIEKSQLVHNDNLG